MNSVHGESIVGAFLVQVPAGCPASLQKEPPKGREEVSCGSLLQVLVEPMARLLGDRADAVGYCAAITACWGPVDHERAAGGFSKMAPGSLPFANSLLDFILLGRLF